MIHRCFGTRSSTAILSLFLLPGLFVPKAHARSKEKHKDPLQPTEVGIYLVGHLSLPETSVSNIASSGDPDRQSIALSDAAHGTLTLVDVTHPERPRLVQQASLPREFSRAALKVQAGNVGLLSGRETDAAAGSQSITLVSFADPAHAATLQKFEGVTALWTDPERELIYLANPDGLWILQIYSTADKRAAEQFDEMLKGSGG